MRVRVESRPRVRVMPASQLTAAPDVGIESRARASPAIAWAGLVIRSSIGRADIGTATATPVAVPVEIMHSAPPMPKPSASAARSAAPRTTGVPGRSPRTPAASGVRPRDGRRAGHHRRQLRGGQPERRDPIGPPLAGLQVVEERPCGTRRVGRDLSRQAEVQVVLWLQQPASLLEPLGLAPSGPRPPLGPV